MKLATKTAAALALVGVLASPLLALAQAQLPPSPITDVAGVERLITRIFNLLRNLFFVIAAFFILWAGWTYLQAGGDPTKIEEAKNRLLYAVVAIAVAVVATGVVPLVRGFLGA